MKHLQININKLDFQWQVIFKQFRYTLNYGDRVSIVGPNGAGKTSLLKILSGEVQHYDGSIENIGNLRLGYLKQVHVDDPEKKVSEKLKEAFPKIISMEAELRELEEVMWTDTDKIDAYTSLLEQFQHIGGYDYENKIHGVANGIGILDLLDKKISEVSGGQRTKIALAKVLLESPDMLFLDEPTNFIDMHSVEWLESYLQNKWVWGYVIVSHDREFLDKTTTKTIEIQPERDISVYHFSYSQYVAEREREEKKKIDAWEREQEYIKKQENLINRFRAGSRAGWAKSREKMLDRMDRIDPPYIPKKPRFMFDDSVECPNKVFTFKDVFIGRKDPLFYISEAILYGKQRVGIVGENGVGKSTFLKTIIGQLEVLDGYFSRGKWLQICYYSQMHEELLRDKTVRENFLHHGIEIPEQQMIGILKHYLFDREDLDRQVSTLSWWQTSKLLFAILWQKESNVLILDEPTNHLDYDTREALELAISNYKGSLLFISHDRYFVNKVATHVWFISEEALSISYGNYEDYRFKLENGIDMDLHLFDEEAELNLVLEEKLGEKEYKRLKDKFGKKKR